MNQLDYDKHKEDITIVDVSAISEENWTFNPSSYALGGLTTWSSGDVLNLFSDDEVYMAFGSYFSGSDISDIVDNNIVDVDSSPDIGTHSNFTAQQYGPDLANDELTEGNNGTNNTLGLYVDTDDGIRADWTRIGTNPHLDAIDYNINYIYTSGNNELAGNFGFADSGKSTETINTVTIQLYARQTEFNNDLEAFVWNGSIWLSLGTQSIPTSWTWVSWAATSSLDTWSKIDGAEIYLQSQTAAGVYEVDCARLQINYTNDNFELDLEVQWTNANYNETNEELCIYGGTMDTENITVKIWNGLAWESLLANISSGWNNASITSYLISSDLTIKFEDIDDTNDTTQNRWNIDVVLLHVWTHEQTVEVEFSGSSNMENWKELYWTIDSAWTTSAVSVMYQFYNYVTDEYPTTGEGFIAYTSGNTPGDDEERNQTIIANPSSFKSLAGDWKIRVKGVKTTDTQFELKADLIESKALENSGTLFAFRNEGPITSHLVALWINNVTKHQRYGLNIFINPGETESYLRSDIILPTRPFIVKIVTERGNIELYSN
ncbi:MAG: hypothetical protein JSV05_06970 [Candidatus Bathyarchaeota archaeon]|nr:MAG: hypothetical protein JSV05_06970 [Candidatus Bathyarchaeota archaeon]